MTEPRNLLPDPPPGEDVPPEGVSVAVPDGAESADVIREFARQYPQREFTGRILHVSDPGEAGPGLTEWVAEVLP